MILVEKTDSSNAELKKMYYLPITTNVCQYYNSQNLRSSHSTTCDGETRDTTTSTCEVTTGPRLSYSYDALGRPVSRNADTFGYNARGEVISSRRAAENAEDSYSYDDIGNLTHFSSDSTTNAYSANCLNQYVSISGGASPPGEPNVATTPSSMLAYDLDGNLVSDGVFRYSYDAENRLVAVRSASLTNGAIRVLNSYDHNDRRVRKTVQRLMLPASVPPAPPQSGEWTTTEAHTFFYDDWNLIEERISRDDGTDFTNRYIWGKDISGSLQGAGGVGGLVAVSRNGLHYFPIYDNNGNVTKYLDESGTVVAAYTYDAFGRTVTATGPLADTFPHRFSTKYFNPETGLYYYGYRFYHPVLMRWINRDPIAENGGMNLYMFCTNDPVEYYDKFGLRWQIIRDGGSFARAYAECDSIDNLANIIGLSIDQYKAWASQGTTRVPDSPKQIYSNIDIRIPNTFIAYWAGDAGRLGRWWVDFNTNVRKLQERGFRVSVIHHSSTVHPYDLHRRIESGTRGKWLHGLYFWGHGYSPYPSSGITNSSGDAILDFRSINLSYQLAETYIFACDSNSGLNSLSSQSPGSSRKGFDGTLFPINPWGYGL